MTNTNTTATNTTAARQFYAEALRQRRGAGCFPTCPDVSDFKRWALRSLGLAGPRGKLP